MEEGLKKTEKLKWDGEIQWSHCIDFWARAKNYLTNKISFADLFSVWIQLLPVKLWVCYGLKIPRKKDVGSQNVL